MTRKFDIRDYVDIIQPFPPPEAFRGIVIDVEYEMLPSNDIWPNGCCEFAEYNEKARSDDRRKASN